ncbi:MAG: ATP-dependent helicase C-terminal domain-containing protein [Akkermansia sp.]
MGYKDIREREIIPVLRGLAFRLAAKALDDYAPVSLTLPNGQHAKVRYGRFLPGDQSTVQRLFGVAVSTHCQRGRTRDCGAGPQLRPWQVTGSLESFWRNGYGQMKDLAGRYPGTVNRPQELDFLPVPGDKERIFL